MYHDYTLSLLTIWPFIVSCFNIPIETIQSCRSEVLYCRINSSWLVTWFVAYRFLLCATCQRTPNNEISCFPWVQLAFQLVDVCHVKLTNGQLSCRRTDATGKLAALHGCLRLLDFQWSCLTPQLPLVNCTIGSCQLTSNNHGFWYFFGSVTLTGLACHLIDIPTYTWFLVSCAAS